MTTQDPELPPPTIDLNALLSGQAQIPQFDQRRSHSMTLKTTAESPEEQASRLRRESIVAYANELKGAVVYLAALVGVAVIFNYCLTVMNSATIGQEEKKWAMATLTAIVSGLVGFLVGKK